MLSQLDIPKVSWTTPDVEERLEERMAYYDLINNHLKLNEDHIYLKFLREQAVKKSDADNSVLTKAIQTELANELVKRIITFKLHARKLEDGQSEILDKGLEQLSLEFSICNLDTQVKNIIANVKANAKYRQLNADQEAILERQAETFAVVKEKAW